MNVPFRVLPQIQQQTGSILHRTIQIQIQTLIIQQQAQGVILLIQLISGKLQVCQCCIDGIDGGYQIQGLQVRTHLIEITGYDLQVGNDPRDIVAEHTV